MEETCESRVSGTFNTTKVNVGIRLRPLIATEVASKSLLHWKTDGNTIQQIDPSTGKHISSTEIYPFDHVFGINENTEYLYTSVVSPIIQKAFNGFSGTILCYGQTSSGKTFTLYGDENEPGILSLAADEIFKRVNEDNISQYIIRVGLIEVYNEKVTDMMNSHNPIKIVEQDNQVVPTNLVEIEILDAEGMLEAAREVQKIRKIRETKVNNQSSRSHTIVRISMESISRKDDTEEGIIPITKALLNFVDLAGSEKAAQTGATGEAFNEAKYINTSLSTLSRVVSHLTEGISCVQRQLSSNNEVGRTPRSKGQPPKHISFRDSQLTRLLQSSLEGNAYIAMICNVAPAYVDETKSTLRFAKSAKKIQTQPKQNILPNSEYEKIFSNLKAQQSSSREILNLDSIRKLMSTLSTYETFKIFLKSHKRKNFTDDSITSRRNRSMDTSIEYCPGDETIASVMQMETFEGLKTELEQESEREKLKNLNASKEIDNLKKSHKLQVEETKRYLESKVESLELEKDNNLKRIKTLAESLEKERSSYVTKEKEFHRILEEQQLKLEREKNENIKLFKDNILLKEGSQNYREELQNLQSFKLSVEIDLDNKDSEIEKLKEQMFIVDERNIQLSEDLKSLKCLLESNDRVAAKFSTELQLANYKYKNDIENLRQLHKCQLDELQCTLHERNGEIEKIIKERNNSDQEISTLKAEIKMLKNFQDCQKRGFQEKESELAENMRNTTNELKKMTREIERANQQISKLNEEIKVMKHSHDLIVKNLQERESNLLTDLESHHLQLEEYKSSLERKAESASYEMNIISERVKSLCDDLEKEKCSSIIKETKFQQLLEKLQLELESRKVENTKLFKENELLKEVSQNDKEELKNLQTYNVSVKIDLKNKDCEIKRGKEKLIIVEERNIKLNEELKSLKCLLDSKERLAAKVSTELKLTNNKYATEMENLQKLHECQLDELQCTLQERNAKIGKMTRNMKSSDQEVSKLKAEIKELEKSQYSKEGKYHQMKSELMVNMLTQESEFKKMSREVESGNREISKLNQEIEAMKLSYDLKIKDFRLRESELIADLESQHQQLEEHKSSLERKEESASYEMNTISKRVKILTEDLEKEKKSHITKEKEFQHDLEELQLELKYRQDSSLKLFKEHELLKQSSLKDKEQFLNLQSSALALSVNLEKKEREIENMTEKAKIAKKRVSQLKKDLQSLKTSVETKDRLAAKLSKKLKLTTKKYTEEMEELRKSHECQLSKLQCALDDRNAKIGKITKERESCGLEMSKLKAEILNALNTPISQMKSVPKRRNPN